MPPYYKEPEADGVPFKDSEKPPVHEASHEYPMEKFPSRTFEKLVKSVFDAEISAGEHVGVFDKVHLMQGTGERGRDVIFYRNGQVVGVAQCKHSVNTKTKVDRPTVARELIKLILNSIQDPTLLALHDSVAWFIITNTSLTEEAVTFVQNPEEWLRLNQKEMKKWIGEVLTKFSGIALSNDRSLEEKVLIIAKRVRAETRNGVDLSLSIDRYRELIAPQFFRLKTVVDAALVERLMRQTENPLRDGDGADSQGSIGSLLEEYLEQTLSSTRLIRTLVLRGQAVDFDKLYEPLTLRNRTTKAMCVIDQFPHDIFQSNSSVLITSVAGSGKSTVVTRIAVKAIEQSVAIPVIVRLRRLDSSRTLYDEVLDILSPLGSVQSKLLIAEQIQKGGFIFLLDGYDEISDRRRVDVVAGMRRFFTKCHRNRFIITSRPDSDLSNFSDFYPVEVMGLEHEKAFSLLRRIERLAETSIVEHLLEEIDSEHGKGVQEFLGNPLLVSLLYSTYRHSVKLPLKRSLFYQSVLSALYSDHDLQKDRFERQKRTGLQIDEFEVMLCHIAWTGLIKFKLEYQELEILDAIKRAADDSKFTLRAGDFLFDIVQAVPMMVVDGDAYVWVHRSLQDYFAAKFLFRSPSHLRESALRRVYDHVSINRFAEMIKLLAEIDKFCVRHTWILWILREYEQCSNAEAFGELNAEDVVARKRIEFELRSFGVCFYSEEFLQKIKMEKVEVGKRNDSNWASYCVHAHLETFRELLEVRRMWGGGMYTHSQERPVFALRFGNFHPKVSVIIYGIMNALNDKSEYGVLYAKNRAMQARLLGQGPLPLNSWVLNTGEIISPEGRVCDSPPDMAMYRYINDLVQRERRLLVAEQVAILRREIEKEVAEKYVRDEDLFTGF